MCWDSRSAAGPRAAHSWWTAHTRSHCLHLSGGAAPSWLQLRPQWLLRLQGLLPLASSQVINGVLEKDLLRNKPTFHSPLPASISSWPQGQRPCPCPCPQASGLYHRFLVTASGGTICKTLCDQKTVSVEHTLAPPGPLGLPSHLCCAEVLFLQGRRAKSCWGGLIAANIDSISISHHHHPDLSPSPKDPNQDPSARPSDFLASSSPLRLWGSQKGGRLRHHSSIATFSSSWDLNDQNQTL